ncbi:Gts1p [Ascoidea rubescens DSM 1968]|uniref:ArfGap-domain-containing protein n=1 Tax=Ascoidea rubescens DSM 1968 TaxID=1344418 RepID=A0A1D2VGK9_9ASCO|nr:ArfGap-domain-containing protein [Ascoidea rubescens DSM 1968]ODV60798.1 ArfGap-domain-containing protein [Ascoidea rubescens DSM 1968]
MSKRQQLRVQSELKNVVNSRANKNQCAECASLYPTWASWNLGIFLCARCASCHRKLGSHLTKVKSLTLDNWSEEQVMNLKKIGNKNSNKKWNPRKIPFPYDDDDTKDIEKYFRDKYILKKYMFEPTGSKFETFDEFQNQRDTYYDQYNNSNSKIKNKKLKSSNNLPKLSHRKISNFENSLYSKHADYFVNLGYKKDHAIEAIILAQGDNDLALEILNEDNSMNDLDASNKLISTRNYSDYLSNNKNYSNNSEQDEDAPPLPKRAADISKPTTNKSWWNDDDDNDDNLLKEDDPKPAVFDGTSDYNASTASTNPSSNGQNSNQYQQYLDPTTGIVYMDPSKPIQPQNQQFLQPQIQPQPQQPQQQQMFQVQQTGFPNQQLFFQQQNPQQVNNNSILSLYNQPQAQPQTVQNTFANLNQTPSQLQQNLTLNQLQQQQQIALGANPMAFSIQQPQQQPFYQQPQQVLMPVTGNIMYTGMFPNTAGFYQQ